LYPLLTEGTGEGVLVNEHRYGRWFGESLKRKFVEGWTVRTI